MDPMTKCELSITLQFAAIDHATMQLVIVNEDRNWLIDPGQDAVIEQVINLALPTDLDLIVSGKDMTKDTVLDQSGQIIQDKYIKICEIKIDNLPVPTAWLEQKLILIKTDGECVNTNYFGFNGRCRICFAKSYAFLQILSMTREIT